MRKVFVEPVVLPEPRFRDGLGIRYVRTDSSDDPVEVLRPLWDVGSMQAAIRQRVSRLATFRQARFVAVRGVEVPADDPTTIEIISDHISGYRLSQYLEAARARTLALEANAAVYVVRELLGALAVLHESRGVTHGAIGPERILITPKGRVVVADYVLGPAIERLEFTRARLWREFRVPCAQGKGAPSLDDAADVLQVGVTALALLAGRPIDSAEYPDGLDDLLSSVAQAQGPHGRALVPAPLVGWVKRALRKENGSQFANVREARMALEAVLSKQHIGTGGAAALKSVAEEFGRQAAVIEADAAAQRARSAALAASAALLGNPGSSASDDTTVAASDIESVPAFELLPDSDAPLSAESGAPVSMLDVVPDEDGETETPVGWRVPEPAPLEETLPTSPMLQMEASAETPGEEGFVEEVLDLGGLVEDGGTQLAAANEAVAAADAPYAVDTVEVPEPPVAEEAAALCAVDTVEAPELPVAEEPAVVYTVESVIELPSLAAEPASEPAIKAEPAAEGARSVSVEAEQALLEEDAPVGAAFQAEPDEPPHEPLRSFVEEILTLQAAQVDSQAAVGPAASSAAGVESRPSGEREEPGLDEPAGDAAGPDAPVLAGLRTRSVLDDLLHAYGRNEETPAGAAPSPVVEEVAAEPPAGAEPEAVPSLPADWFIEVGAGAVRREAEPFVPPAPAQTTPPEPARLNAPHAHTEAVPEDAPSTPAVIRRREVHRDEDRNEPIFPRVSPSVRRVRAEARARRLARMKSGATEGIRAIGRACAAGVSAVAGAVAGVVGATGRAISVTARATARGGITASTAMLRVVGAAARGLASGLVGLLKIAAAACAAVARGSMAAAALAGSGLLRVIGAAARACRAAVSMTSALAGRSLRAAAGAVTAGVRFASRGAAALIRAVGAATAGAVRGAGVGLVAVGRAARAAAAGMARALGAGGKAARAAAQWSLRASAGLARGAGAAAAQVAARAAAATGHAVRGSVRVGSGAARLAAGGARRLYFAVCDIAGRLPVPVFRPWYPAAALLVIVAVAGVPFARAHWFAEAPAVGTLRVESSRPGLQVKIDGVPKGQTPLSTTITAGRHRVEVDGAGKTRVQDVEVTADQETVVRAGGASLRATGSIRLASEPDGAEVWLDGVLHGTSPLTIESVTEGPHTVMVRDASGTVRRTVQVRANETAEATVQIRPGWLAVFAPVRLDMLEGGRLIGSTERGRILVPPGEHTIELVGEAFGFRQTCRVQVTPGEVTALTVQMPPATLEVVAPAESEIFVDGQSVGKTPLEPVRVAVGTREVLMRHPTIGERRQVITVTYASANRVAFE